MGFLSVLSFAHKLIMDRVHPGDIAIDATAGTGADTLLLAQRAGRSGQVYALDIQDEALRLTQERLDRASLTNLAQVSLLLGSHADMKTLIPEHEHGQVSAVMFNLGYLPADIADKRVITETDSTLIALETAIGLLRPGGVVTIVLYPGHAGGEREAAAVESWTASLPSSSVQTVMYRGLQRSEAPYLIAIERKKT
ncbi:class I SAM-dependent methyltransferase [Paenibacillus sp. JCM 10914]|uniref:class I SAM-dependent methyltransferase n=1 Tax=Paenibacillus sp. JCM 10914 TaxID=1236974 RepID=UPI0003CCB620|nr:class I SAM-dependent methyltransferase [Paenibacillus sp. JCM 10914]GAE05654.1 SAM-dependent methyltransferase, MraW methylase family [Paenibacillus sp. JCM 10914]